jgi:hypothetical protein
MPAAAGPDSRACEAEFFAALKQAGLVVRAVAAAGALALAAARAGEPDRPGPLTAAAEQLTRAGRVPWRQPAPTTPRSRALRAAARDLTRLGRLQHGTDSADWLHLLAALAGLAAAIRA